MFKEFFNLKQTCLFAIHDPVGVKFLSRLQLKFSHFKEQNFCHNFKDVPSTMCNCGSETETTDCTFFCRK